MKATTRFRYIGIFIKLNNEYYYVDARGRRMTHLYRRDLTAFSMWNFDFDRAIVNGNIELMPQ